MNGSKSNTIESTDKNDDERLNVYKKHHKLAYDLLSNKHIFCEALREKRKFRRNYQSHSDHWFASVVGTFGNILLYQARALDIFYAPWLVVSVNAIIWTVMTQDDYISYQFRVDIEANFFISACLAFLLVFRLNRVAIRWWDTRTIWGGIVAQSRTLTSEILEHTHHMPENRDEAIRWICTYIIAVKQFLRGEKKIDRAELSGIISHEKLIKVENAAHPGLYCLSELHHTLKRAYSVNENTPIALATSYCSDMRRLEIGIHLMTAQVGGLERIKATPLPIVFVTHLRSLLFLYLMSLPYLNSMEWGWFTIPIVSVLAFSLLGIDAAAHECEIPFSPNRVNHLDMEGYCLLALKNITQLVCHSSDIHIRESGL